MTGVRDDEECSVCDRFAAVRGADRAWTRMDTEQVYFERQYIEGS